MGRYLVTFANRYIMEYSPEELYTFNKEMTYAQFATRLVNRMPPEADTVNVYLTPHDADIEAIQNSIPVPCTLCTKNRLVGIEMTYSIKESKRLLPPYETNCWDYRSRTRYTSRDNCLNEC